MTKTLKKQIIKKSERTKDELTTDKVVKIKKVIISKSKRVTSNHWAQMKNKATNKTQIKNILDCNRSKGAFRNRILSCNY